MKDTDVRQKLPDFLLVVVRVICGTPFYYCRAKNIFSPDEKTTEKRLDNNFDEARIKPEQSCSEVCQVVDIVVAGRRSPLKTEERFLEDFFLGSDVQQRSLMASFR